ncbi:hypothetical protein NO263_06250 [Gluconacetobacter entanii]|uniref:Uncharacterized protein n=1 Tax=Gluconacetobacter entanii TaxID=108528 RepID=A0ABT3K432_9PROT|nr:hypothetical protein [Gluconacetobacter entanii]MCW4590178.1 hypothetical protein [Gluconacetobacter entanii]MCW4593711.1 hypothetical protein [Gluconacetobacter entanii]NPC87889.1 hypothetical protein [Gluconacetobacter entanii]
MVPDTGGGPALQRALHRSGRFRARKVGKFLFPFRFTGLLMQMIYQFARAIIQGSEVSFNRGPQYLFIRQFPG